MQFSDVDVIPCVCPISVSGTADWNLHSLVKIVYLHSLYTPKLTATCTRISIFFLFLYLE
eukprot:c24354_g1_i1 orf=182-361(+)